MAIEEIHLVGHSIDECDRDRLPPGAEPVIRSGADAMDKLFPGSAQNQARERIQPDITHPQERCAVGRRRTTDTTRSSDSDVAYAVKRRSDRLDPNSSGQ